MSEKSSELWKSPPISSKKEDEKIEQKNQKFTQNTPVETCPRHTSIKKDIILNECYKKVWKEKNKCHTFLQGKTCSDPFCIYSHSPDAEFGYVKCPIIELACEDTLLKNLPFHYIVYQNRYQQSIRKETIVSGTGKYPTRGSTIYFYFYGLLYKPKEKKTQIDKNLSNNFFGIQKNAKKKQKKKNKFGEIIFADHRTQIRSFTLHGRKKGDIPFYFNQILFKMKENEIAFVKVHPNIFELSYVNNNNNKYKYNSKGRKLLRYEYIYYYIKIKRIKMKKNLHDLRFKSHFEGLNYIHNQIYIINEIRNKALKCPIEKTRLFLNTSRNKALKIPIDEYKYLINILLHHNMIKGIRKNHGEVYINKKNLLIKIYLKLANCMFLKRDYKSAINYCKLTLQNDINSFQARRYLYLSYKYMKKKKDMKCMYIEMTKLYKNKDDLNVKINEKQMIFYNQIHSHYEKIHKKKKMLQKKFIKILKSGAFYANVNVQKELQEKSKKDLEKKKQIWFDENGVEFEMPNEGFDKLAEMLHKQQEKKKLE